MAWQPKYKTSFIEPIVNNMLDYIRANAPDALLWANWPGITPLPTFVAVYNSRVGFEQESFPDLMVDRITSILVEKDDESGVEELHKITLIFELTGSNPTELTARQWRYMKALDSMLRTMPHLILMSGMLGAQHCGTDVVSHDYGVLRGGGDNYFRQGALVFAISMEEDRNG